MIPLLALLAQVTMNLSSPQQTWVAWGAGQEFESYELPLAVMKNFWSCGDGICLTGIRVACYFDGTFAQGDPNSTDGGTGCGGGPCWNGITKKFTNIATSTKLITATGGTPVIIQSTWSGPASCKSAGSRIGGTLLASCYTSEATRLGGCIDALKGFGVTVGYQSLQNEPDFSAPYDSTVFTAAQLTAWANSLGPTFHARSPSVQIGLPEVADQTLANAFTANCEADGSCPSNVDIYPIHEYFGGVSSIGTTAKPRWMTEWGDQGAFSAAMALGLTYAARIHADLTTNNIVVWISCSTLGSGLINGDTSNCSLIGTNGEAVDTPTMTKKYYVLGQYSKFVKPGMIRYALTGSPPTNVSVTAWKDPTSNNIAVVAINNQASTAALTVTLDSTSKVRAVMPWTTDATHSLSAGTAVTVSASAWTYTLTANSVTTFVGPGT